MALDLEAPDHTTISRRSQQVDIGLRLAATKGRLHLIVDSTGLSINGEGEWAAVKHGVRGKRAWKKLHHLIHDTDLSKDRRSISRFRSTDKPCRRGRSSQRIQ
jgi:hypothetical protein